MWSLRRLWGAGAGQFGASLTNQVIGFEGRQA